MRVTAVEEGFTLMERSIERIAPGPIAATGLSESCAEPPIVSFILLGHQGAVRDIANSIVLVTGEALVVDGGPQHLSSSGFPSSIQRACGGCSRAN